ncbi:MAG: hypothetical protein QOF19_1908 [Alphaproteobacteria bacterium]|jgi:hypothetical protein|nr:hypothetical protein [Alphaproteobacteria bacterium]
MKMFIVTTVIAFTAVAGSPAFAQHHANIPQPEASAARAEAPGLVGSAWSYPHRPEYDVYVNGNYVGSDPDPRIRQHLKEEWQSDHMN